MYLYQQLQILQVAFLLMVPKKDLIYLDISFEQASKFIVSAGTTNID